MENHIFDLGECLKRLSCEHRDLGSIPRTHAKKKKKIAGMEAFVCHPSAEKVETARSLKLNDLPLGLSYWAAMGQ